MLHRVQCVYSYPMIAFGCSGIIALAWFDISSEKGVMSPTDHLYLCVCVLSQNTCGSEIVVAAHFQ